MTASPARLTTRIEAPGVGGLTEMNVFLVQTSGADIATNAAPQYVAHAEGPRFCDEPLSHHRYFNAEPFWERGFLRRQAWQTAGEGDVVLLYCTGSVDENPSQLSHVFQVADKTIINGGGAWLCFDVPIELEPPISHSTIQREVESGGFSEGMARCGQEGFNIRPVREADLETVKQLAQPRSGSWIAALS